MNARNRVFVILGLLTIGSFVWFLFKGRHDGAAFPQPVGCGR